MNASAAALIGFVIWMLLLLSCIGAMRTYLVLTGNAPAGGFRPDGTDVSPFAARLSRTHANCYESFPFIGGTLLLAIATGTADITNPLAIVVLFSRVAQSSMHLLSVGLRAIRVRFLFFLVQVVIVFYWAIRLARSRFLAG